MDNPSLETIMKGLPKELFFEDLNNLPKPVIDQGKADFMAYDHKNHELAEKCVRNWVPIAEINYSDTQIVACLDFINHQSDVIEKLVTAYEAKVLTLEELDRIHNMKFGGVWPYKTPPYLWITKRFPGPNQDSWICWRDIVSILEKRDTQFTREAKFTRDDYGVSWMIWTKQPTKKQRNAAKWITPHRSVDELLKETQKYVPNLLFEELKEAARSIQKRWDDR